MKITKDNNINPAPSSGNTRLSRRAVISLKAKAAMKRTWPEIGADWLADSFGTITFFVLNAVWFIVWMFFNLGIFKNITQFDPFPFGLLTMAVSLEAIFLSIIVLISQNRSAKVDELRQEVDLQLNIISEKEITKVMEMLSKIMEHNHLNISDDPVLKEMLKPVDTEKIEDDLNRPVAY